MDFDIYQNFKIFTWSQLALCYLREWEWIEDYPYGGLHEYCLYSANDEILGLAVGGKYLQISKGNLIHQGKLSGSHYAQFSYHGTFKFLITPLRA